MDKKISTRTGAVVIGIFALLFGGIIFVSSHLHNSSISGYGVAPIPQKNNAANNQKIAQSQPPKRFSGSGCYAKDKGGYDDPYSLNADFNLDDADTEVKYENEKKGISFDVPYNAKWGNKNCKVEPYTEFIQPWGDVLVEFGKPQAWIPSEFRLTIMSPRSSDDILGELDGNSAVMHPVKKNVAGNQAVSWSSLEDYDTLSYEIVGKKYNYRFDCNGSSSQDERKKLEQIISSVKIQ